ncbi:YciI family protein [Arthrobacter celericrescens]|uniref:YciI family protein n=1 Tax=Arthrobacter celericrescens TaxID=2320851 RepID=UPI000EA36E08|nr:YciI family protein [Arthrobacter celericrescens]
MTVFAVEYVYDVESAAVRDEHRPAHRAWVAELAEQGTVLASGPYADGSGALILVNAADESELNGILKQDPFAIAQGLASIRTSAWNPVIGLLAAHTS